MKLAAIDIGSNAVRLQVSQIVGMEVRPQLKNLEYIRFPLSLGKEVFTHQYISQEGAEELKKLLQAFKLLIELYGVDKYRIYGTCFWREAKNKLAIKAGLEKDLGVEIQIANGEEEADLINQAVQAYAKTDEYLHIDVGGGSTEISFYKQGARLATQSFSLGSLKDNSTDAAQAIWDTMEVWITQYKSAYNRRLIGIATGGNIRKLAQIAKNNGKKPISFKHLSASYKALATCSLKERIQQFHLNPDRAAIILPASQIYLKVLSWAGIKHILVPPIGLKDGIIQSLYKKYLEERDGSPS